MIAAAAAVPVEADAAARALGARVLPSAWHDAALAAALLAIDPVGIGGASVRALAGPVRDRWLALVRAALPPATPLRRVPLHISDGRLLGGLDLAATLQAGRPIAERGLLAEADGGVIVLVMAERLPAATAARLTAVLDTGEVVVERDGIALRSAANVGVIALDEGIEADERLPAALADRLAFHLDLSAVTTREATESACGADEIAAACARLPAVDASPAIMEALCGAAMALGIASIRAPLLAVRVARGAAALAGRTSVAAEDAAVAARLVLAPRATRVPAPPSAEDEAEAPPPDDPAAESPPGADEAQANTDCPLEDRVLEAAEAAIPAGMLAALRLAEGPMRGARTAGRAGVLRQSARRGRPIGARRGEPRAGARLNVIETLRAAAPWQRLRRASRTAGTAPRIEVRRHDFHITRFRQHTETTTLFVVDASGSAALHRLAEAKGAVELLLADCYVRRDRVALIAFRGRAAELLLPPTRSLVRAKRSLAGLPGGGGTPLAIGIDAALGVAEAIRRHGETPIVVLLTDGRANIGRDGEPGRARAEEDALAAARLLCAAGFTALVVDTSPQPHPQAERLAAAMGATYLPLPHAGAAMLSTAVQAAVPQR